MKRGFSLYQRQGEDQQPNFNLPSPKIDDTNNTSLIKSLFALVQQQSAALQKLSAKVEAVSSIAVELAKHLNDSKKENEKGALLEHQTTSYEKQSKKAEGNQDEDSINSEELIRILFGPSRFYKYYLRLASVLELPLYRQRNFSLEIELIDSMGKRVVNSNKIPLSLALYTSQNPPKFIERNTMNQQILKGYVEQNLIGGTCRFTKIQIRQVTSHFRNGLIHIVIIPCMTPLGTASDEHTFIQYNEVTPLVLERISVKAKRFKSHSNVRSSLHQV